MARMSTLQAMLDPQAAPVRPAAQPAPATAGQQQAFAQQLQAAMQQQQPGASPYGSIPFVPAPGGGMGPYGPIPAGLAPQGLGGVAGPQAAPSTQWLTGDTKGLNAELLGKLNEVGRQLGKKVNILSGFRSRAEQAELYQRFLNGTGNLAAPPGRSNHESGNAADVYIGGVALASHPQGKRIAQSLGLHWPVGGEPWHTELRHRH